jgi:hypothetical protein
MQPPHLHYKVRAVKLEFVSFQPLGLRFVWETHPPCTALYAVSVFL